MTTAPLYVSRALLNADAVLDHFRRQGLRQTLPAEDLHVTIAYSLQPLVWENLTRDKQPLLAQGGARDMHRFDKGALVMRFASPPLERRWWEIRRAGATWSHPDYQPHVTISYQNQDADPLTVMPYPGVLEFGPERFCAIETDWAKKIVEKNAMITSAMLDSAVVVSVPAIIKSRLDNGRRVVEVEASSQEVDSEGDVILQSALLDSAQTFVATGCLDIDHLSEVGYQLGIPDPASYVVGRPLEVRDIGGGRTSVIGEIRRSLDGTHNPQRHRYDDLWESLQSNPQVPWYASVYGFPLPGMIENCADTGACVLGARRFLIKGMNWRSLAFTRRPVNQTLRGRARIITAKAAMAEIAKSMGLADAVPPVAALPRLTDIWAGRDCSKCGVGKVPTLAGYRDHFEKCCGMPPEAAELCGYALMHKTNMERVFSRVSP